MDYKSIRQTVHMSRTSERPEAIAEREYRQRIEGWSTFRSGIVLRGHEPFVVNFRELAVIVEGVREREHDVAGLWNDLPTIARRAYLFDLIGAEMQSTNSIEGVRSTRKEISEALEAAISDGPHKRFSEFAKLFLALGDDDPSRYAMPETLGDIRGIYDRVMAGELAPEDAPDGELFREGAVYIDDQATGRRVHTGITPESEIKVALTQWLALARDRDVPPLIRAALCHFAFEYIHPFYDGNGRTGRFRVPHCPPCRKCSKKPLSLTAVGESGFSVFTAYHPKSLVFRKNVGKMWAKKIRSHGMVAALSVIFYAFAVGRPGLSFRVCAHARTASSE